MTSQNLVFEPHAFRGISKHWHRSGLMRRIVLAATALSVLALAGTGPVFAQVETVIHSFTGQDGSLPGQRLTLDSSGNLYGTTVGNSPSIGSVFKVSPTGQFKVLYQFTDQNRLFTTGKLVIDKRSNLYGVDQTGGEFGEGAIFKLTQSGVYTVLYSFTGKGDGAFPNGVISDGQGNFYGTTNMGGAFNQGTVFEFNAGGLKVLYSFTGSTDGGESFDSALYRDAQGNLYGTTMFDGGPIFSFGVVFKVTPSGEETVLHAFQGGSDGAHPKGSLISDGKGNLYGTTSSGEHMGGGTVFRITESGVLTGLHTFSGSDGFDPDAGLAIDADRNLFGTTFSGGASNDGVVFEISATGDESVLHNFSGSDGSTPYAGVILGEQGNLFGTTGFGGASNKGTIFKQTQ